MIGKLMLDKNKITTKDCVSYLCSYYPETADYYWKRRNKHKVDDEIHRTFENIATGEEVIVIEKDGKLTLCTKLCTGWLYAIVDDEKVLEEMQIIVTSRKFWKENRHVNDDETPEKISSYLILIGLEEVCESTFMINSEIEGLDKKIIKMRLESLGFVNDFGFQEFCAGSI